MTLPGVRRSFSSCFSTSMSTICSFRRLSRAPQQKETWVRTWIFSVLTSCVERQMNMLNGPVCRNCRGFRLYELWGVCYGFSWRTIFGHFQTKQWGEQITDAKLSENNRQLTYKICTESALRKSHSWSRSPCATSLSAAENPAPSRKEIRRESPR